TRSSCPKLSSCLQDEIQLVVSGTAVRLADAREPERRLGTGDADDDIFGRIDYSSAKLEPCPFILISLLPPGRDPASSIGHSSGFLGLFLRSDYSLVREHVEFCPIRRGPAVLSCHPVPQDEIQLVVSGTAVRLADAREPERRLGTGDADDDIFALDEEQLARAPVEPVDEKMANGQTPTTVSLTSVCTISGARAVRRVCALRLLFVRETTTVRELGGLSGFLHTFTCEVLAIARAYTAALGGNALTSFYITQLMLQDNAHKNQGQCLLSVGGDVVHITY
ncbi:uncharacterized protein LOC114350295, partial [Ostrinia furnacalis]|uniref:uncharacterized protein LOC114350295 n=1 Tax=Ostrinia furnacalis TaxID=93504 RepID=UPI00103A3E36